MTADDALTSAVEAWLEQALRGEPPDPQVLAREHGVPVAELQPRIEVARWLVARHCASDPGAGATCEVGPGATGSAAAGDSGGLARYRILKELGRGGQAVVHLAEDTQLHRLVALKLLSGAGPVWERALQRFRREAEITSRLDHPGICAVYDAGVTGGTAYIVMRHVEGETLARRIARDQAAGNRPTTWAEVVQPVLLIERVARALHQAHEHGVLHRDVKPSNIMITADGDPMLVDFGLAADASSESAHLTNTGDILGTPAYLSPEQLSEPSLRPDRRADVFSLGVTLYECLTLARPFAGPTREALYAAIRSHDPPDARRLNPAIPPDLATVLATALEKHLARRYATALAFAEDLQRVSTHQPILARPAGPMLKLRRWMQRNPGLAIAATSVFVVLAAGVAVSSYLLHLRNAALLEWTRLADLKLLRDLTPWSARLWPAAPERIPGETGMDAWLQQARDLEQRRPDHAEALQRLRATARVVAPEPGAGDAAANGTLAFADPSDDARHQALAELVAAMAALPGDIERMEQRRTFAATVQRRTIDDHRVAWDAAIAAIADETRCPRYRGLRVLPQRGLVPLGENPRTGLHEFAHLQTGVPPRRDAASGQLAIDEQTGLVFVLLPPCPAPAGGGEAEAGAATTAPVPLHAFFLSAYEMTQAQWLAIMGDNPSDYRPPMRPGGRVVTMRHPVEMVSHGNCEEVLRRLGMQLPTDAQWEYACRAGSTTTWHTGDDAKSLQGFANVADEGSVRLYPPAWSWEPGLRDGYGSHAPVGSFAPNAFGLFDMHGNVMEWCRDGWSRTPGAPQPGDGFRADDGAGHARIFRGGSFFDRAAAASSGNRGFGPPGSRVNTLGLRPALALEP